MQNQSIIIIIEIIEIEQNVYKYKTNIYSNLSYYSTFRSYGMIHFFDCLYKIVNNI